MPDCKELKPFPLVPIGIIGRLGKSEMAEIGFRVSTFPSGHHRSIGSPRLFIDAIQRKRRRHQPQFNKASPRV
jgi:hypothetical protein